MYQLFDIGTIYTKKCELVSESGSHIPYWADRSLGKCTYVNYVKMVGGPFGPHSVLDCAHFMAVDGGAR